VSRTSEGRATRSTTGPFLAAAGVVLADQLTKIWATEGLADGPVEVVGETLQLKLTRNPGGAFSIATGMTPILAVLAAAMTVVIYRVARRTDDRIMAYALAGVLGGALGNLVDRVFRDPGFLRGHVVDFIDLSFWPTFNVADCGISIGVVLVLVRGWKEPAPNPEGPEAG
jgi:signal peptidase II